MSARARDWADAQTVGNFTLKAVLKELGNLADDQGMLFRSQATLADRLECCAKTIRRALQVLETKGLIRREVRERRDGSRSSDRVYLNLPEASEAEAAPCTVSGPKVRGVGTDSPQGRDPGSPLTSFESARESTIESSSGPGGPAPRGGAGPRDFRKDLFERGTGAVRSLTGRPAVKCRALIGKWLGLVDDDAATVLAAIDAAEERELAEPVGWIEAQLRAAAGRMGYVSGGTRRRSTNGALSLAADMIGVPDDPADILTAFGLGAGAEAGASRPNDARNDKAMAMALEGKWPSGGRILVARDDQEGIAWERYFAGFGTSPIWIALGIGPGAYMPSRWPPGTPQGQHGP